MAIALALVLVTVTLASSALSSTIVVEDSFTDGRRTGARDSRAIEWFSSEVSSGAPTALSVRSDAALESNALIADNPAVPAGTFDTRAIVGLFTGLPQTLGTVGATLTLSFDFRFGNPLTASGENRLRFGLYSTSGTASNGDGSAATRDDRGYWAQTAYGSVAGNTALLKEGGDGTSPAPVSLGSRRELFVDTSLLASITQATLELQTPKVAEMSLNFMERPWEGSWSGQGPTILKDGDVYRMYYYGDPTRWNPESEEGLPCYAESQDGITWTRPNLRQVQVSGTWDNNVLLMPDPSFHHLRPFIDTRRGVPLSQKYKAVTGGALYRGADGAMWTAGLYILVSPDGLRWSKYSPGPFLPPQRFKSPDGQSNSPPVDYDGMNTMFWSEREQVYVCYYRGWVKATSPRPDDTFGGWYRWVRRTSSHDLVTWSPPVNMESGGLPLEHWYFHSTSPYFRAPHIYIAMPSHYIPIPHPDFQNLPDDGHSARSETRFASSRDGLSYDRLFSTQRWITTGLPNARFFFPDQRNWPVFAGRMSLNVVPTGPREVSVYLEQPGRIVRYTLRTDGFVALRAAAGQAITRPITFTGKSLEINFATGPGGHVRVELQDATGRPLPGFTIADATPMTGDEISRVVTWGANSDLGALAGQAVRMHFELQSAKVFSFRFFPPEPAKRR